MKNSISIRRTECMMSGMMSMMMCSSMEFIYMRPIPDFSDRFSKI